VWGAGACRGRGGGRGGRECTAETEPGGFVVGWVGVHPGEGADSPVEVYVTDGVEAMREDCGREV
jgi:hypothetical protein